MSTGIEFHRDCGTLMTEVRIKNPAARRRRASSPTSQAETSASTAAHQQNQILHCQE